LTRAAGLLVLAALTCTGCRSDAPAPLSPTFPSADDAARAVLDALAVRDVDALLDLSLDEHEFRQIVWPELPSSRPEVGLPVKYAWGRLHQTSRAGLALTLAEHGGRRYQLVSLTFRGETTRYLTFAVHRDTELVVREAPGAPRTVRIFGSLLEREGQWKVFSYVVD
jgi:hypothetical protein